MLTLRLYILNPNYGQIAGAFKQGNSYYVRFGNKLKQLGTDSLDVVQVFAHELSHIGRLKFIGDNSSEFIRFQVLHNSEGGREFIKRLVTAWHNGKFTKAAQQEYEAYISDPEEFIAALGQYYLLKGTLPAMSNEGVDADLVFDMNLFEQTTNGIIAKIYSFVRNMLDRLVGVWSQFEGDNPEIMKEVNSLMDTLFGWDAKAGNPLAVSKG